MIASNISYTKIGKGKPIMFLHGWGCDQSSLYCFKDYLLDHQLIFVDLPGFGKTKLNKQGMDIYDYAEAVYLLIVKLGLHDITLVCHSFGGRIGIILSSIFDTHISHLILISAAGLKPRFSFFIKAKIVLFKLCKRLHLLPKKLLNKMGSEDYKKLDIKLKSTFCIVIRQYLDYLLPSINIPVLIFYGTLDKTTPPYMAKRLHKHIPNSGLIKLSKVGHFGYLQYVDKISSCIRLIESSKNQEV